MHDLLIALAGAVLALLGNALLSIGRRGIMAKRLAEGFFQELSAARFVGGGPSNAPRTIGGFSSQTFDSLFREATTVLPPEISRELMQYHWRMKYLDELQERLSGEHILHHGLPSAHWHSMNELNKELRPRLRRLADTDTVTLSLELTFPQADH